MSERQSFGLTDTFINDMKNSFKFLSLIILFIACKDKYINQTNVDVLDNFKIEKLLSPSVDSLGSWVSLAHVKGRKFVASDQYGKIYWLNIPSIGSKDSVQVEALSLGNLGKAQGLLWAHNSLYVMMSDQKTENSGLYRLTDTDNDGVLDAIHFLKQLNGWGEHGPHGVQLGPDDLIYVIAGNHTDLPEEYTAVTNTTWKEDRLFEPMKDPNGHAQDRTAPGGWIARTDSLGSFWEIYSSGYRNAYDIAFNEDGELFTFDSDMEWDLGLPWYRPVRVCHVTAGSEFGWRTGSGKWPAYYPDNLPGILAIGQGSPTGVVAAKNGGFPAPFNSGLFVCDWSFGTMYHISLEAKGASYEAQSSEFLSGIPLPLTDLTFGDDGAMYFTTGGRKLESGLYRVWHDALNQNLDKTELQEPKQIRKLLETYQDTQVIPDTDFIWTQLGSEDRYIRFSARIALENQGVDKWAGLMTKETPVQQKIEYALAVARSENQSLQFELFNLLKEIDLPLHDDDTQLKIIRAQGLLCIRNSTLQRAELETQWGPVFPSENQYLNEEIAFFFTDSQNPIWLEKTMNLWSQVSEEDLKILISDSLAARSDMYGQTVMNMRKRRPKSYKIALTDALSRYQYGWTLAFQNEYFTGFNSLWDREGGYSYRGYLLKILERALSHVEVTNKIVFEEISGASIGRYGQSLLADLPVPEGPGRNWSIEDVVNLMQTNSHKSNHINGAKMFEAALCQSCHMIQGKGSAIGPELTQLATRFSIKDMAQAIIEPSAEISDQYMLTLILLNNGDQLVGKITDKANDTLSLMINPLMPTNLTKIPIADIKNKRAATQSQMFPALLNRLNEQEVFDLMTYLLTAGNAENE